MTTPRRLRDTSLALIAMSAAFFIFGESAIRPAHPRSPQTWWSRFRDRKSTRLNSSHVKISYAVFCLKRYRDLPALHSFPTRRSSDLAVNGSGSGPWSPQGVDNDDPAATEGYFIGVDRNVSGILYIRRISDPAGSPTISADLVVTVPRSEEHTSELQSRENLVCRLLLETLPRPSRSTLFPYTTLFRSGGERLRFRTLVTARRG